MRLRLMSGSMLMVVACGGSGSGDSEPASSELEGVEPVAAPPVAPGPAPTTPPSIDSGSAGAGGGPDEPAGYDCDTRKITCQTFAPVVCPDGQVPTVVNECYGECVPKDKCAPVDSGEGGGVVCAAFIEQSDGKCSRAADDPCRSQDPDCKLP